MDDRLQRRVQRYGWDAASSIYEDAWRESLAPAHRDAIGDGRSPVGPGEVVETAAGTGLVTFRAARAVAPGGSVTATDISGEMVSRGTATAAALGASGVTFERMDSEALTYEDASFDRGLCALGLMYMPKPSVALAEMRRVLRTGGRASVAVWGERRKCGWADLFPIVDARVHSEVCPLFFGLGAPGALVSDMKAAGFSDIEERRIESRVRFPNEKALLAAMIDGGAVAMATKRFSEETRRDVDKEFLSSVAQFRANNGGYDIPGEFVVASGLA